MKNVGLYETKGMLVKAGRPKLCVKAFIRRADKTNCHFIFQWDAQT